MRVLFLTPAIIFFLAVTGEVADANLYREAVQAETEGLPEVSVTKLRQFLAGNPSEPDAATAKLLLAKCLAQVRQPEEALTVLNDSSLTSAEAEQLKAETLLRAGHWDEAAGLFRKILNDAGSDTNARLGLAKAQLKQGESAEALATLQPLLENGTNSDSRAILMTAEIEVNQAKLDQATMLLSRLSEGNDTEQLQKQCLLGQIAIQAGKLNEAETAFSQVISANKGLTARLLAIAQLGLARVEIQQQEFDEAESVLVPPINPGPSCCPNCSKRCIRFTHRNNLPLLLHSSTGPRKILKKLERTDPLLLFIISENCSFGRTLRQRAKSPFAS
jgi:predicted negative regulator of RcsB-dependent stress response